MGDPLLADAASWPRVDPINAICESCGAPVGDSCLRRVNGLFGTFRYEPASDYHDTRRSKRLNEIPGLLLARIAERCWIDEAARALDAASIIGRRSCRPGDGLHLGNHDRLLREASIILGPVAGVLPRTYRSLDRGL